MRCMVLLQASSHVKKNPWTNQKNNKPTKQKTSTQNPYSEHLILLFYLPAGNQDSWTIVCRLKTVVAPLLTDILMKITLGSHTRQFQNMENNNQRKFSNYQTIFVYYLSL